MNQKFLVFIDLGTGEETVSVERTQVFVLNTVQTNTTPLQLELHEVFFFFENNF